MFLRNLKITSCRCLSALALRWDAMCNMAKIELKIIPDPYMYIFFEKCTRDGVSYISKRYSKVSNRYLQFDDPKQESKHIIYFDTNNLYDHAMSNFIPTIGFKWVDF